MLKTWICAPAFPVTLLHWGNWRDDLNDFGAQLSSHKTGKPRVRVPASPISKAYRRILAENVWKNGGWSGGGFSPLRLETRSGCLAWRSGRERGGSQDRMTPAMRTRAEQPLPGLPTENMGRGDNKEFSPDPSGWQTAADAPTVWPRAQRRNQCVLKVAQKE